MIVEPYESVLARLRAAAATDPQAGTGAVAFDGDGTLWSGDVGEDFLEALLAEDAFTGAAMATFAADAERHCVPRREGAKAQLHAIFEAYGHGRFAEDRMCELIALGVAGRAVADVSDLCDRLVESRGLAARLHEEALGLLAEARALGLEVFLVSASPRPIVVAAARLVGVDAGHVVAATVHEHEGLVTSALDAPIPYGEGKVTRLRRAIGERPLVLAAGDNVFDLAMLAQAEVPVAIRPKQRLLARAAELPRLVAVQPRP